VSQGPLQKLQSSVHFFFALARCARTNYQGILCLASCPTVPILPVLFSSARCARIRSHQGIVGCIYYTCCMLMCFFLFGMLLLHARLLGCCRLMCFLHMLGCCRLLYISCMLYFSSARYARTYSQSVEGCMHESSTRAGFHTCCTLLYLSYVLYFSSARCARTHSQSFVGCRHEFYTLAVGWFSCVLYFSSARCARTHSQSVVL